MIRTAIIYSEVNVKIRHLLLKKNIDHSRGLFIFPSFPYKVENYYGWQSISRGINVDSLPEIGP